MNIHDQQRKEQLVRYLNKAKEQAIKTRLYLTVNDRPLEELYPVNDALDHIEAALEALGVTENAAIDC